MTPLVARVNFSREWSNSSQHQRVAFYSILGEIHYYNEWVYENTFSFCVKFTLFFSEGSVSVSFTITLTHFFYFGNIR